MSKYQIGDEVVFLTNTYNNGVRFKITKIYFKMIDSKDSTKDKYSYLIESGITNFLHDEEGLYWIPAGTIDRPKEN